MDNLIYSVVTKDDKEYYNIAEKISDDMGLDCTGDFYAFAIDKDTKKIVGFYNFIGRNMAESNIYPYNLKEEVKFNIVKVANNFVKMNNIPDRIQLFLECETWNEYQELNNLGFEVFTDDIYFKDVYDDAVYYREEITHEIEETEKVLQTCSEEEKNFHNFNLKRLKSHKDDFHVYMVLKGKNINQLYAVEGYVDLSDVPKEYIQVPGIEELEVKPFKTTEEYNFYELRKTDEVYRKLIKQLRTEITDPNLRANGGMLHGYTGLNFPELLVYLRDKKTNQLVGYEGLTENYGIGLYISQIAVKNEYKHKGIGTLMVNEAMKIAADKKIDVVSADIGDFNKVSQAFFSGMGFKELKKGYGRYTADVKEYISNHEEEFQNDSETFGGSTL